MPVPNNVVYNFEREIRMDGRDDWFPRRDIRVPKNREPRIVTVQHVHPRPGFYLRRRHAEFFANSNFRLVEYPRFARKRANALFPRLERREDGVKTLIEVGCIGHKLFAYSRELT